MLATDPKSSFSEYEKETSRTKHPKNIHIFQNKNHRIVEQEITRKLHFHFRHLDLPPKVLRLAASSVHSFGHQKGIKYDKIPYKCLSVCLSCWPMIWPPMIAGGVHFVVIVVFCSILTTLEPDSMTFASEALEVEINSLWELLNQSPEIHTWMVHLSCEKNNCHLHWKRCFGVCCCLSSPYPPVDAVETVSTYGIWIKFGQNNAFPGV